MSKNIDALESVVKFIYDNIQYAEFNTKSDYCHECGFDGEIIINKDNEWECPNCGNKDHSKMTSKKDMWISRRKLLECWKNKRN